MSCTAQLRGWWAHHTLQCCSMSSLRVILQCCGYLDLLAVKPRIVQLFTRPLLLIVLCSGPYPLLQHVRTLALHLYFEHHPLAYELNWVQTYKRQNSAASLLSTLLGAIVPDPVRARPMYCNQQRSAAEKLPPLTLRNDDSQSACRTKLRVFQAEAGFGGFYLRNSIARARLLFWLLSAQRQQQ